jgi:hypothetical protein
MLLQLIFWISLIGIGAYAIYKEEKLIQFERAIVRAVKGLFSKPEKVVALPGESEASKQARFATGAAAGNELYSMGGETK